jgi:hypothetical protein
MLDPAFGRPDSHCSLHRSIGKPSRLGSHRLVWNSPQFQYARGLNAQNSGILAITTHATSNPNQPYFRPQKLMSSQQNPHSETSHVYELGKVTVFYIPSHKLDDPRYFDGKQTARTATHEFLMHRYRAYTQSPTPVKGYWTDQNGQMVHDVMERFEVSFGSEAEFERLIEFLIELCNQLTENAIYVTRGERSFLVQRISPILP